MGWTGGYCLVAFLLAPYLRKFGQFTIPDFLGARYGGNIVRSIGIIAAIICSRRLRRRADLRRRPDHQPLYRPRVRDRCVRRPRRHPGVLDARRHAAVTWTQVAQYIILIIAYLTPVIWLGVRHTGVPIPQIAYGQTMQKLAEVEKKIFADPREADVRKIYSERVAAATAAEKDAVKAHADRRAQLEKELADLRAANAPRRESTRYRSC